MAQKKTTTKRLASPLCYYIAGGVFLIYSLIFPFYRLSHYLIGGGLALLAWAAASRLLPGETVEVEEAPVSLGDAAADKTVSEGRGYLIQLDALRDNISSPKVTALLQSIHATCDRIMSAIADDPKKAPMVRRLMSYYLPTLIKLADFYEKLEEQGGQGENIEGSMRRIEQNLETLDSALKKQLDLLYENDALDISTDISVMENMLAQEGLSGGLSDEIKQMGGQQ